MARQHRDETTLENGNTAEGASVTLTLALIRQCVRRMKTLDYLQPLLLA